DLPLAHLAHWRAPRARRQWPLGRMLPVGRSWTKVRWQAGRARRIREGGAMIGARAAVGLVYLVLLAGCASSHAYPVKRADAVVPCQMLVPERDLLLGVALSGGGSRAALYGAAGLEALARVRTTDGASLIEKISHLSSVSGGSISGDLLRPQETGPGREGSRCRRNCVRRLPDVLRAIPRRRQSEPGDIPHLAPAPVLPVAQLRARRPDSRRDIPGTPLRRRPHPGH